MVSFHFMLAIIHFIFFENKKLNGFLPKPIFSFAFENAVNKPVLPKRCRFIALSYLLLLICFSNLKRLLHFFCFLSHINISFKKGLFANNPSLPFLNKKSICARG